MDILANGVRAVQADEVAKHAIQGKQLAHAGLDGLALRMLLHAPFAEHVPQFALEYPVHVAALPLAREKPSLRQELEDAALVEEALALACCDDCPHLSPDQAVG